MDGLIAIPQIKKEKSAWGIPPALFFCVMKNTLLLLLLLLFLQPSVFSMAPQSSLPSLEKIISLFQHLTVQDIPFLVVWIQGMNSQIAETRVQNRQFMGDQGYQFSETPDGLVLILANDLKISEWVELLEKLGTEEGRNTEKWPIGAVNSIEDVYSLLEGSFSQGIIDVTNKFVLQQELLNPNFNERSETLEQIIQDRKWNKNSFKNVEKENEFINFLFSILRNFKTGSPWSIREVLAGEGAQCFSKAFLAAVALQKQGFEVYWHNVFESTHLIPTEAHASILFKKQSSDSYVLFDPSMDILEKNVTLSVLIQQKLKNGQTVTLRISKNDSNHYVDASETAEAYQIQEADRLEAVEQDFEKQFELHPYGQLIPQPLKGYHQAALRRFIEIMVAENINDKNTLEQALKLTERLVQMNEQDPFILNLHASVLEFLKRRTEGFKFFKKALEILPQNPAITLNYANCLASDFKLNPAIFLLEKVLKFAPTHPKILYQMARFYYDYEKKDYLTSEMKYHKKALKLLNKAQKYVGSDTKLSDAITELLGGVEYHINEFNRAEKLTKFNPRNKIFSAA